MITSHKGTYLAPLRRITNNKMQTSTYEYASNLALNQTGKCNEFWTALSNHPFSVHFFLNSILHCNTSSFGQTNENQTFLCSRMLSLLCFFFFVQIKFIEIKRIVISFQLSLENKTQCKLIKNSVAVCILIWNFVAFLLKPFFFLNHRIFSLLFFAGKVEDYLCQIRWWPRIELNLWVSYCESKRSHAK